VYTLTYWFDNWTIVVQLILSANIVLMLTTKFTLYEVYIIKFYVEYIINKNLILKFVYQVFNN
jgi:hypothetical protein